MVKKVGFIMILMVAVILISWFLVGGNMEKSNRQSDIAQVPSLNNGNKFEHPKNEEEHIENIFALALRGKVPHISIVAGETKIKEVYKDWGKPDKIMRAERGYYDWYEKKGVTIGYHDKLVFEIRSAHPELQHIHLNKIIEMHGEPDDVQYYTDERHNQKILVYKISENYQLNWVFANQEENPVVDHISVVTTEDNPDENY